MSIVKKIMAIDFEQVLERVQLANEPRITLVLVSHLVAFWLAYSPEGDLVSMLLAAVFTGWILILPIGCLFLVVYFSILILLLITQYVQGLLSRLISISLV